MPFFFSCLSPPQKSQFVDCLVFTLVRKEIITAAWLVAGGWVL